MSGVKQQRNEVNHGLSPILSQALLIKLFLKIMFSLLLDKANIIKNQYLNVLVLKN